MNDLTRAALRSFIESVLALAMILGVFKGLDVEANVLMGALMLVVTNGLTTLQLFWKTGQGNPPPPADMVIGEDPAQSAARKASE